MILLWCLLDMRSCIGQNMEENWEKKDSNAKLVKIKTRASSDKEITNQLGKGIELEREKKQMKKKRGMNRKIVVDFI